MLHFEYNSPAPFTSGRRAVSRNANNTFLMVRCSASIFSRNDSESFSTNRCRSGQNSAALSQLVQPYLDSKISAERGFDGTTEAVRLADQNREESHTNSNTKHDVQYHMYTV